MFPQGGPGVALLLLRISVAIVLVFHASRSYPLFGNHWLLWGVALLVGAMLTIGFMTPYLSAIACVAAVAALFGTSADSLYGHVSSIVDSAALALLGPGAYSIDAKLFGRRVLVVPSRRDSDLR
jgi:uncharacterized membrane protein YphA (DoxX/SURF4 family)